MEEVSDILKLKDVLSTVMKRITPNQKERKQVCSLAEKLKEEVENAATRANSNVKVRIEGSIAKNTWLKESPEIDIFMRVPTTVMKEEFGTKYLDLAKEAMREGKHIERFAEHPYLEVDMNGILVNIVPCYQVKKGEWRSAADRTPLHTDYVRPLLDEELCGEIRLLKQFMKGIHVYGAEIKIGGFSGYLCELLVLVYGSFLETLKAATDWKLQTFIDLESHYEEARESVLKRIFNEPLVVVDPVDMKRNVASPIRQERLEEFIVASRAFLQKPDIAFFYPPVTKPFTSKELLDRLAARGSSLVFIQFGSTRVVPDILWGQLYKSLTSLRKLLRRHDFVIVRDTVWSDTKNLNTFLIEVEHRYLPTLKKHLGPPLEKKTECQRFIEKYLGSSETLSGPHVENGRWVVERKRKYNDVVGLLKNVLKNGGKSAGIAKFISKSLLQGKQILVDHEILATFSSNREFAVFLTEYLVGKSKWLVSESACENKPR